MLSAINMLIERVNVDEKQLGVFGTSYGGYATNLLIAQTNRFAAAVNISGKVDMISFPGDSPKIGTRNYNAAEKGQDRIGATLWESPMKYIQHSAIMFADRIQTPLPSARRAMRVAIEHNTMPTISSAGRRVLNSRTCDRRPTPNTPPTGTTEKSAPRNTASLTVEIARSICNASRMLATTSETTMLRRSAIRGLSETLSATFVGWTRARKSAGSPAPITQKVLAPITTETTALEFDI